MNSFNTPNTTHIVLQGTRLVREPDELVGGTGLGSRTRPSFFLSDTYLAKCLFLVRSLFLINQKSSIIHRT